MTRLKSGTRTNFDTRKPTLPPAAWDEPMPFLAQRQPDGTGEVIAEMNALTERLLAAGISADTIHAGCVTHLRAFQRAMKVGA